MLETSYEMSGISPDIGVSAVQGQVLPLLFLPLSFLDIANSSGEVTRCTEHMDRCCVALTGDSVITENTEQKVVGFNLESQMAIAVSKCIPDLCKLFMQLHGILSLFRDSVMTTIITQIHK